MKRFLFSIALLFTALAGCSNHEGESAAPKSELNVMSYNIRYANASDKGRRGVGRPQRRLPSR